jgi:PAS domain S-box-containing protein
MAKKIKVSDLEMLNALLYNIPDSIYFKDLRSRFLKINKALVKRLGIESEEEATGKTDFDFFSEAHAKKAFIDEQEIIATGKPLFDIEEKETYEQKEDRWVSTTKMPLYSKKGEIIGTFGISRDITEAKKIQRDLKKAKYAAEKSAKKAMHADKIKSQFLANMSHEIRTPMNAIMGFAEILKEQVKKPQHLQYIDIILSSSMTLLELINDILDLSKVEAGKMELQYSPVDPQVLFNDIVKVFSAKLQSKGLKLLTKIDEDLPGAILIDEVRTRQILFNLVGNAVKFTSEGYIELKVKCIFCKDRSKIDLVFSVKDTGIGISQEAKDNIFNAFAQGSNQDIKKYGGTGLGLSITKKLVELMKGDIEVESTIGKGSIFKVILRQIAVSSLASGSDTEDKSFLNVRFKNQKVLIVDDIESNRLLLDKVLRVYNLNPIEASNGKEAINVVKSSRPAIILMDLRMPVMDGYKAIKKIKNNERLKKIPIIVLTASTMKSDEEEIKTIQSEGFLRKPVNRAKLISELKKHLDYEMLDEKNADTSLKIQKGTELPIKIKQPSKGKEISDKALKILENEFSVKLEKIKKEFIIDDIESFAKEVKDFSKKHSINDLETWALNLLKQASEFDSEKLEKSLGQYYQILKMIRDQIG